jgi:hypothetical protein
MSFYQRHVLQHLLHFAMRVIGPAEGRLPRKSVSARDLNLPLHEGTVHTVMVLEPSRGCAAWRANAPESHPSLFSVLKRRPKRSNSERQA